MRETNFKETEIGLIPADWEVKTLGEMSYPIKSGNNRNRFSTGNYPVFGSTGLIGYSDFYLYDFPSILVARVGANAGLVYKVFGKYDVSDNTLIINLINNNGLEFVLNILKKQNLNKIVFGSGQPLITATQLKTYQLPLPPTTDEQAEIANAISSVDKLIEKIDRLIVKKENFKLGTMQQLLSGKQRLKGFNGKWVEKPLGEVFTFLGNNTLSRDFLSDTIGEIYNIHYGDVLIKFGEILDMNNDSVPRINFDYDVNHSYLLNDGDIVMADTAEDETVGKVTELANCNGRKIVAGLHTFALRPLIGFAPRFLGFALNFSKFHNQLIPLIQGSKVASISKKAIVDTIIFYPSDLKEQEKIANLLTSLNTEIATIKKEREKYLAIKQGMMQQLLTGKIRLV